MGRSIAQGREAGVASAFGISMGSILHTFAAALGLSAILATSAFAFVIIKLLGGAYLVFLGIKLILDRRKQLSLPSHFRRRTTLAAFRQGILTNILNPKVALFFLAFLPQFIDPSSDTKVTAFLLLGFTFVTTGTIWCLILAWFAYVSVNDSAGTKQLRVGSIDLPGRFLFFSGCELQPRNDPRALF